MKQILTSILSIILSSCYEPQQRGVSNYSRNMSNIRTEEKDYEKSKKDLEERKAQREKSLKASTSELDLAKGGYSVDSSLDGSSLDGSSLDGSSLGVKPLGDESSSSRNKSSNKVTKKASPFIVINGKTYYEATPANNSDNEVSSDSKGFKIDIGKGRPRYKAGAKGKGSIEVISDITTNYGENTVPIRFYDEKHCITAAEKDLKASENKPVKAIVAKCDLDDERFFFRICKGKNLSDCSGSPVKGGFFLIKPAWSPSDNMDYCLDVYEGSYGNGQLVFHECKEKLTAQGNQRFKMVLNTSGHAHLYPQGSSPCEKIIGLSSGSIPDSTVYPYMCVTWFQENECDTWNWESFKYVTEKCNVLKMRRCDLLNSQSFQDPEGIPSYTSIKSRTGNSKSCF